jgi:hypothetical protein
MQPPGRTRLSTADGPCGGARQHLHTVGGQLGADQGAQARIDGGQHVRQLLQLDDGQAAAGQRVGHLQADVPGADDQGAGR